MCVFFCVLCIFSPRSFFGKLSIEVITFLVRIWKNPYHESPYFASDVVTFFVCCPFF